MFFHIVKLFFQMGLFGAWIDLEFRNPVRFGDGSGLKISCYPPLFSVAEMLHRVLISLSQRKRYCNQCDNNSGQQGVFWYCDAKLVNESTSIGRRVLKKWCSGGSEPPRGQERFCPLPYLRKRARKKSKGLPQQG